MSYYKTTPIDHFDLVQAFRSAKQQDELVMAIFRFHRRPMTPSQVHEAGVVLGRNWLITSVRRSMSNLAKSGALEHLDVARRGPWGRAETTWMLPNSAPIQVQMFKEVACPA